MHYLFARRLNMLDIAIHSLSDEELLSEEKQQKLAKEYCIEIPELNRDKAKAEIKKEKLTSENAPENFHVHEGQEYQYFSYKIPFSSSEYISDILKLQNKHEGLSVSEKELEYREYSHSHIEEDGSENTRLRRDAEKAIEGIELCLDEFAANAVEFNQMILPKAIVEKCEAERMIRIKAKHLQEA